MSRPDFVIIGAHKSGSTFLQLCLRDHPDVYMPKEEIPFFESPDYEKSDISLLENIFKKASADKLLGIKRPNYLAKKEVPARIKKELPDVKLIAVLRDPIERAVSAYFHHIRAGFFPPIPIEKGLEGILSGKYKNKYPKSDEIIEYGLYYEYLNRYLTYFNKNNMKIIIHDNLFKNKLEIIQSIYQFLGINEDFSPKSLDTRPQRVFYNLTRLKFLTVKNKFEYEYYFGCKRLKKKKNNFWGLAIANIIRGIDRYILDYLMSNTKPCINRALYEKLVNIYRQDVVKLAELIDKNLNSWLNYDYYKSRHKESS